MHLKRLWNKLSITLNTSSLFGCLTHRLLTNSIKAFRERKDGDSPASLWEILCHFHLWHGYLKCISFRLRSMIELYCSSGFRILISVIFCLLQIRHLDTSTKRCGNSMTVLFSLSVSRLLTTISSFFTNRALKTKLLDGGRKRVVAY